jgi:hypothetical protein
MDLRFEGRRPLCLFCFGCWAGVFSIWIGVRASCPRSYLYLSISQLIWVNKTGHSWKWEAENLSITQPRLSVPFISTF